VSIAMARTLISALEMLTSLQRWNFLPRIETWTETENATYTAHMAYLIAKETNESEDFIKHLLLRIMLQSLRKYEISDISKNTVNILKSIQLSDKYKQNDNYFNKLIDYAANKTVELFPRPIGKTLGKYIEDNSELCDRDVSQRIEHIFKYCKCKAALQECLTNSLIYENYYKSAIKEIEKSITEIDEHKIYDEIISKSEAYLNTVRNLKYLRRWNRINRSIETSVLAHTYVVTLLAIVYSLNECDTFSYLYSKNYKVDSRLDYLSILRSLFHDLLESLTGDVITPVKTKINELASKYGKTDLWEEVENKYKETIRLRMPDSIKEDDKRYSLLDELSLKIPYSVESIVKQCDMLALIIECIFELKANPSINEMQDTYSKYIDRLKNSEWLSIRQLTHELLIEFPSLYK
jgi:putative hydrolase of HD superfamily